MDELSEVEAVGEAHGAAFARMERVLERRRKRLQHLLQSSGLSPREHQVLACVARQGGCRLARLADRCLLTRQSAHSLVGRLTRLGLVKTAKDAERREVWVLLTDDGQSALAAAEALLADFRSGILQRFGVAHHAALTSLLEKLDEALALWAHSPHLFDD